MSEQEFDLQIKGKTRILRHLSVGEYLRGSQMVRIVPVEAPKNYTADVVLRKGKASDSSLPVVVKKTVIETEYPYLTRELGEKIGKGTQWVAKAVRVLRLMGDTRYHQSVRSSKSGEIHRYSVAAETVVRAKLGENPDFNPYLPELNGSTAAPKRSTA